MISRIVTAFVVLVLSGAAVPQTHAKPAQKPPTLVQGIGNVHHPVSTKNAQAQSFFDQGLRYIYAFNHDEAARSFERAAKLDPKLAIAYWGVAEAVGPNYNDPASDERFVQAHEAIQKAVDSAANASPSEKAYIDAMAMRFPADPKADRRKAAEQYHAAMRDLVKRYPDDLDAATLFAESGMNLHPWGLWHHDGKPEEGTEEIMATLLSVIRRDPDHVGANHYYIHAVEASPHPEMALASANKLAALAPAAGHLVHMPAHVYIRTGDYASAVATNVKAAAADQAYLKASGAQGIYPMMYYSHNLHFIAICASMNGNYPEAKQNADLLAAHVRPHAKEMPPIEPFLGIPMAVNVRFHKWDAILKTPKPDPDFKAATLFWHYGRGMAFAAKGNLPEAQKEYDFVAEAEKNTPEDAIFAMPFNNKTKDILKIAQNVLGAKIALAKKDPKSAIAMLQEAITVEDSLKYGEPPDWPSPVRESLGGVLLSTGDNAGAERVFREDLERNRRNPRSLFGLMQALKAQGKNSDAFYVEKQFRAAWKGGPTMPLKVADLV